MKILFLWSLRKVQGRLLTSASMVSWISTWWESFSWAMVQCSEKVGVRPHFQQCVRNKTDTLQKSDTQDNLQFGFDEILELPNFILWEFVLVTVHSLYPCVWLIAQGHLLQYLLYPRRCCRVLEIPYCPAKTVVIAMFSSVFVRVHVHARACVRVVKCAPSS